METLHLLKIKKNKLEKLQNWFTLLDNERRIEAISSLKHENRTKEIAAIIKIGDEYYCIGYTEHTNQLQPADMRRKINKQHKAILKECTYRPKECEIAYRLER
jgi:hypothetical protein